MSFKFAKAIASFFSIIALIVLPQASQAQSRVRTFNPVSLKAECRSELLGYVYLLTAQNKLVHEQATSKDECERAVRQQRAVIEQARRKGAAVRLDQTVSSLTSKSGFPKLILAGRTTCEYQTVKAIPNCAKPLSYANVICKNALGLKVSYRAICSAKTLSPEECLRQQVTQPLDGSTPPANQSGSSRGGRRS